MYNDNNEMIYFLIQNNDDLRYLMIENEFLQPIKMLDN